MCSGQFIIKHISAYRILIISFQFQSIMFHSVVLNSACSPDSRKIGCLIYNSIKVIRFRNISIYIAFFINTDIDILVFLETKNQPFHLRSLRNFLSCKEYHTIHVATLNMLFKLPVGNIYGMLGPNFSSLRRTLCKP